MEDGDFHVGVWLQCQLSTGFKTDEAFVRVLLEEKPEPPSFYVSRTLVRPAPTRDEQPGQVRVTLLHRDNGRSTVEVPGEPLSFGPRLEVPSALIET